MSKPRILIVEDEAIVARDIRQQLIKLGYEPVATAAQGDEAIALAGGLRPDLVLMDIHLAGKMDGIAAAQTIRDRFALPVVFLTAFADDEVLSRAKLADPFGYIIKPFEERELRTVLEVALFKHGAEQRLRQSHEVQTAILRTALDGFWLLDMEGRILEVNDACCEQHGYSREEMLGKSAGDFEIEESPEEFAAQLEHIRQAGFARFESRHRCKIGPPIELDLNINFLPQAGGRCFAFMRDITARKHMQEEREVTVRLLEVVNGQNNLHDLLQAATLLLRDWSGCSTVGIRLKAGADFPYFEVRGFPAKFVQAENRLCQHAAEPAAGHPALECLCGHIIAGRFDPTQPFFTAHGTFWTNSTTDLLAHTSEAERLARTRNCCRGEGYESMALVPLRVGGHTLGLLQLNDRRRDQFTSERIKFFERLADSLAVAIAYRTANEETLRSERKFRSYVEHSPLGVFVVDRTGRYLEVNAAGIGMFGYSEAELLQMHVYDLAAPKTREEGARRFARLVAHGALNEEVLLRRKDGTEFWSSIVAAKLDDHRFIGFNQDISERKQAETALRESEDRLRTIINSEPECVKLVDADCTLLDMNPAGLRMLSADSLEQVRGRNVCELLAPEYRPSFCEGVAAVFRGETAKQVYEMVAFDGSRHWMEQHAVPLWDAEQPDRVKQMLAVTRDITAHKQAEEALRESEERYRDLFAANPHPMWVRDQETSRFLAVNDAALAHYGYSREEFLALTIDDFRPQEEVARLHEYIANTLEDDTRTGVWQHRKKDGTLIDVEVTSRRVFFGGHWARLVLAIDITARKQAEAELRNSQERLQALYSSITDALFVHGMNDDGFPTRFLEVNDVACRRLGYTRDELLAKSPLDIDAPNSGLDLGPVIAQMKAGQAVLFDQIHVAKDGTRIPVEISSRVFTLDGRPAVFSLVRDITVRKLAEKALSESEEKFRLLYLQTPIAYQSLDAEGRLIEANNAWLELLGYTREEVVGRPITDFLIAEEHDLLRQRFPQFMERGAIHEVEFHMVRKDGTVVLVSVNGRIGRTAAGDFRQTHCVLHDITKERAAEEQLRSSRAELAAIYDFAPVIMCLLDEERRVVHLNHAATALGRRQPEAFLGLRPGDLVGCANSRDDLCGCGFGAGCESCTLRQAIQDTLDTGQSHVGVESKLVAVNDQKIQDLHVIAHTARLDIDGRKRVLLCLEDVTGRKRAEESLRKTEEQFRQAQKMEAVGQLAGGVAHDFNNILAAVLMYLGLLQDEPGMDRKFKAALKELEKEVHRGAALTRQLLAFSRHQAMEPRVLDVYEVVAGLLKMLHRLLGEHIKLSMQGPPDLPRVEADAGMLEQVVINLCVNARDAMPQGGLLTLTLEAIDVAAETSANAEARPGRFLRLSVADSGSGMDEPTLRRIFEPFFTTKGVGKGTGLGLATVYGIVKQHHGWIDVQSTVGRGSIFQVYLPVSDAPAARPAVSEESHEAGGQNELVLVVEDDPTVRAVVAATLQRGGYRTIQAASGPEALRLWEKHGGEVALLFTDLLMPGGLTGRELAERLQRKNPGLKVVIFTGYGRDLNAEPFAAVPGITVLRKPAESARLLSTVRQCLDGVASPP